ncbi:MAG: DUF2079 domain-containing protein [Candidatus Eremiobacteraeota bacterium]|nr:DUF2079 domain-containing protein [Candidatus Eremiobacteraeota bacterium]
MRPLPVAARSSTGWAVVVAALYAMVAAVYAYLGMWRYAIFRAGVDDCIFTQVVNGAFAGFSATLEGSVNHFLIHFSPILLVALPFVRAFDGTRGLIVLQALLAAATVVPVWGIAAARLPRWLAFVVAVVAASYPPLSALAVGDFHELAFAPPVAAALVWAIDRKAWRLAIAAALVLAMVKEDQFVALAFIGGVVVALSKGDRRQRACGIWIAAMGLAGAAFYFGILRPLLDPHFPYFSLHYYEWWRFPATPAGFVGPFSAARAHYLLAILLPLALLPLGSRYALFALPGLAEVLLSHEGITMALGAHYTATWSGYLLCAFADGAYTLYRRSDVVAKGALAVALVASFLTSRYFSPIAPGYALYRRPSEADAARERILLALPRDAGVGTGGFVIAHLGMFPHATIAMDGQEYLIFDAFTDPAASRVGDWPKIARLVASGAYSKESDSDGLIVLKKDSARRQLPVR